MHYALATNGTGDILNIIVCDTALTLNMDTPSEHNIEQRDEIIEFTLVSEKCNAVINDGAFVTTLDNTQSYNLHYDKADSTKVVPTMDLDSELRKLATHVL